MPRSLGAKRLTAGFMTPEGATPALTMAARRKHVWMPRTSCERFSPRLPLSRASFWTFTATPISRPQVRAFFDEVGEGLARERGLFEGTRG